MSASAAADFYMCAEEVADLAKGIIDHYDAVKSIDSEQLHFLSLRAERVARMASVLSHKFVGTY